MTVKPATQVNQNLPGTQTTGDRQSVSNDSLFPPAQAPTVAKPKEKIPGSSDYQQDKLSTPYNQAFFNGYNPNASKSVGSLNVQIDKKPKGPDWGQTKIDMRHFQDGQEHFGEQDPGGFF